MKKQKKRKKKLNCILKRGKIIMKFYNKYRMAKI